MKPEPSPAGGCAPPIANSCENGVMSLLPIRSSIVVATFSVNVWSPRLCAGVMVTALPVTVAVPEIDWLLYVSVIELPTTTVAAFTGSENWTVNLSTFRSYDAFSTCGPLQSTRTLSSAAGETLPSEPTTRTRISANPDWPLIGQANGKLRSEEH